MEVRFYPELQAPATVAEYLRAIPVRVLDPVMELKHSWSHGVLTYSNPALEALLDYLEDRGSKEAIKMKLNDNPGLTEQQRVRMRLDGKKLQDLLIGASQARKMGGMVARDMAPTLGYVYSTHAWTQVVCDFIRLEVKPTHPLEECKNLPE